MAMSSSDREFVDLVRPILETGDFELLLYHIERQWPNSRLRRLLACENTDATKVALFCLSLTGTMDDCRGVARFLRHEDPFLVKLAENTLWSIWFRAGGEAASGHLHRAVQMIGENRLHEARDLLGELIEAQPDFAEAYDQRGITCFLLGRYRRAKRDLRETVRRNPTHFAALAGLGHCYAALGQWEPALAWYKRAARVHPNAEGLQDAMNELIRLVVRPRAPQRQPEPAESPSPDRA